MNKFLENFKIINILRSNIKTLNKEHGQTNLQWCPPRPPRQTRSSSRVDKVGGVNEYNITLIVLLIAVFPPTPTEDFLASAETF